MRELDYGLFTNLPRIVKFTDFSPSSFKLKRGILPLLRKYVSYLENCLSYQAKIFLVNLTPKEITPCKISHICRCAFNIQITSKNNVFRCFIMFSQNFSNTVISPFGGLYITLNKIYLSFLYFHTE